VDEQIQAIATDFLTQALATVGQVAEPTAAKLSR
jgi:hypothetical protein